MEEVKRVRLDPAMRRAQLISLGVKMLADRPLEQISVEEIADQAGVSRGLLFHYFASKHDFHVEIVRENSHEMLKKTAPRELRDGDVSADSLIDVLRGVIASYVDYVSQNRSTYVSLLRGTASGDPDMRAVFEETRTVMADRVLIYLPGIGVERTPQLELAVRGWIAFVEEATISWLRDPVISREDLVDMNVRALPSLALASSPEQASNLLGLVN
ncbi:TetR/AcrR family transcriptional regulator [Rhodococcus sp. NPDC058521]|uniref:TetR/AcrR family transcriptional regulator n=1 Tax=Rhodococcus sp. NPDC058521 TaxID=3346536 RepID=UPI003653476B